MKSHVVIAFFYFLLAATLGFVLRLFYVQELPITYKYIVHAHSHIALLGWVYLALTTIIYAWFSATSLRQIKYRALFWFTQLSLVGMLCSFPFQGYGLFSIIFSTLFFFVSYVFTWFLVKGVKPELKDAQSYACIKMALGYMVFSSLGPWALGGIMTTWGSESIWYRMAIYFYLHFQYNGWMVLGLLGLCFYVLGQHQINMPKKQFKVFFWSMNVGIVPSFFLSTLWAEPHPVFYILGGLGALLQGMAIVLLLQWLASKKGFLGMGLSLWQRKLYGLFWSLLIVKMVLQIVTGLPYFANLAALYTDFTIGYLHWTFLGVVSIGLFFFLDYGQWIRLSKIQVWVYFIGFMLTEVLIFYKAVAGWLGFGLFKGYFIWLAVASGWLVASILLVFSRSLCANHKKTAETI